MRGETLIAICGILCAALLPQPAYPPRITLMLQSHSCFGVAKEKVKMDQQILDWLQEAPLSDPEKMKIRPKFSYEDWFARGRALHAADSLTTLLNQEDPRQPSGNGMRIAYALGWVGQKG